MPKTPEPPPPPHITLATLYLIVNTLAPHFDKRSAGPVYIIYTHTTVIFKMSLNGLCNIVQMRDSGAKVVTSMLDVQLKII